MASILSAVGETDMPVIFPIHPRTSKCLEEYDLADSVPANVRLLEPLPYLDMLRLMVDAHRILTDSGGIQKEAYMLGVPCITLRDTTEWVETIHDGWNVLTGAERSATVRALRIRDPVAPQRELFGIRASKRIATRLNNVRIL